MRIRQLLVLGLFATGLACGPPRGAQRTPRRLAVTLTYSGGLPTRPSRPHGWGIRLWDDGSRVRGDAFGGLRLVERDTGELRAALRVLVGLAAVPPDTLTEAERRSYVCEDLLGAELLVTQGEHQRRLQLGRCGASDAELRARRSVDSVSARLTR